MRIGPALAADFRIQQNATQDASCVFRAHSFVDWEPLLLIPTEINGDGRAFIDKSYDGDGSDQAGWTGDESTVYNSHDSNHARGAAGIRNKSDEVKSTAVHEQNTVRE